MLFRGRLRRGDRRHGAHHETGTNHETGRGRCLLIYTESITPVNELWKGGGGFDTSAESYSTLFMTYQLKSLTYKGKVSFRVYIEKEIQYNTKILNP